MPCPWTPEELAEKLRDADNPKCAVWRTDAECLKAARRVDEKYRGPDPAGRPWGPGDRIVEAHTGRITYTVIRIEREALERVGVYGYQESVTIAPRDRAGVVYESPSPEQATAMFRALNELES